MLQSDSIFFRALQYGTVGFGCICLSLSTFFFWHFKKSSKRLGKAVSLMMAGEAIGIGVTVIFSMTADGVLDMTGPVSSLILRLIIFSAAFVTSCHLGYQLWRIEAGGADD